jgi:16S rRNA (uracil1498-N3)-methyltransferase
MNIVLFETPPEEGRIPLGDSRAEHIIRVLRLKAGDSFRMGLLDGYAGEAVILSIDDEALTVDWKPEEPPKPLYPVLLLVGQVRPICMKRILREAVSLGVEALAVVGTDLGEKSYREAKLWSSGEYRRYLRSGTEQAGATTESRILFFDSVDAFTAAAAPARWFEPGVCRIMLDPGGASGGPLSAMKIPRAQHYVLAVGSERGWSARERKLLAEAGFIPAALGSRILRTETACSAGIAVLLGRLGYL